MKLHKYLLAGVTAACLALAAVPSSADIITFVNGVPDGVQGVFDSGTNPNGSEDRTDTDLLGLVGATSAPITDSVTGLSASLTTIDIIGADGTSAADTLTGTTNFHETNITGSGALAVNSDTDQDTGLGGDAGHFNPGEAWVFSFDNDVELRAIEVEELDSSEQLVQISSADFATITLTSTGPIDNDGATIDFADVLVSAGTEITLAFVSTTDDDTFAGVRSISFGVPASDPSSVPEPSSLALLGLGGLLVAGRRRRR